MMTNPSYVTNTGSVSFTYKDSGNYGIYINECRVAAWQLAMQRHAVSSASILDVGCSYGSWAENWRRLGFDHLEGLEPFGEYAERARKVFDEVKTGYSYDIAEHFPSNATIGSNGVVVHILEENEQSRFLADLYGTLESGGHLLYSVLNSEMYLSPAGRIPWSGPNSCTRTLAQHDALADRAGLRIVDRIGTFINPWMCPPLDIIASDKELKEDMKMYSALEQFCSTLRGKYADCFSEVLYVARRD